MTANTPQHIAIVGEVTHPADGVGGYALYRHPATGIYTVDIPYGVPRVLRSCPQDWARAQHLRAMVRALPHTRDELCAATGITRRALDTYMLPDDSSGHRTPPPLALRAVEALWREYEANKGK